LNLEETVAFNNDFDVIVRSLWSGALSVEQALALFRHDEQRAKGFLPITAAQILGTRKHLQESDPDSGEWRFLEVLWQFEGRTKCIQQHFVGHSSPLVDTFLKSKLVNDMQGLSQDDLERLAFMYSGQPLQGFIEVEQVRRLSGKADQLLKNPQELNKDVVEVKRRISQYNFHAELSELMSKVDDELAVGGDKFDQAATIKHLRTFFEKMHRQIGETVWTRKPATQDNTDLTKCGHALDFLKKAAVNILSDDLHKLGKALYGMLSNAGVHAASSEREYVRLCRNMVTEYALIVFFEVERRLGK